MSQRLAASYPAAIDLFNHPRYKIQMEECSIKMQNLFGVKILPCPIPLPADVRGLVVPPVELHGVIDLRNAIVIINQKGNQNEPTH